MDELRAYEILGLNEGCSREDIKTAYAKFSKEYHPEEYPDEFQQIHEDIAEGLQVVCGDVGKAAEVAHQAHCNTCDQRDQDLHGETHFFLHTLTSL